MFRDPMSAAERSWADIVEATVVTPIGEDRLRIESQGGGFDGGELVEFQLLVRASAETRARGYTHFAILHIRDDNVLVSGRLFGTPIYGSETGWIGTYEDLVASRYERDYGPGVWNWLDTDFVAVVLMLNDDDRRARNAFNADAIYSSLLVNYDQR